MNAERRQNIYSYIQQPDYTRLYINCVHVSVSLIVSVSQSSKSSTAQQVASYADSLSSLLHVRIGHRQISVSRRRL